MFKITLRERKISKGRSSLYLDIYNSNKSIPVENRRNKETLGLYIYQNPSNNLQKQSNKNNYFLAESIKVKKENDLNKPEIYTAEEKRIKVELENGEKDFLKYMESIAIKKSVSTYNVWIIVIRYLKIFYGDQIKFKDVTFKFSNEFKIFLLDAESLKKASVKLSQNTASAYFKKFKAALRHAFKDNILKTDIAGQVTGIRENKVVKHYLTIQELILLAKTECSNTEFKNACMLSALTGLRFSDVKKLKWADIYYTNGLGYSILVEQQKTKNQISIPLTDEAKVYLGKEGESEMLVFPNLKPIVNYKKTLQNWLKKANITKTITFHNFRHTYANLLHENGVDIFTIKENMGQENINSTLIYTKLSRSNSFKAANSIKLKND